MPITTQDRIRGLFLGMSLGKTNGRYALLVADSLIEHKKINLDDLAKRHIEYAGTTDEPSFNPTTRTAIEKLAAGVHWSNSGKTTDIYSGLDNGLLLAVPPLGAFRSSPFWRKLWVEHRSEFIKNTENLALMTHYTRMAADAALSHVFAVRHCLDKNFSVKGFVALIRYWSDFLIYTEVNNINDRLSERFTILDAIDPRSLTTGEIINLFGKGTDHICNSLPFSYAFFLRSPRSIQAFSDVSQAGGDTDTNTSIVGGLLGALNGESIFPSNLTDTIPQKEKILATADKFYETFFG